MPKGLETVGVWIAIGMMVAIACIGYRTTEGLVSTSRWVEHTQHVIQAFDDVLLGATAAVRSRRTYWMTGDDSEIARVEASIARTEDALTEGHELTVDNPRQQARLSQLRPLIESRFDDIRTAIDLQRASPVRNESLEYALLRRNNAAISHIATVIDEGRDDERALLADRQASANRSATFAKSAGLGGTAVSIAIIVFAFARLRSENHRRIESERALRASEQRLATTLYSIGDGVIATDSGGLIEHINRAAEHLTGTSLSDAIGKPLAEVFHSVDEHDHSLQHDAFAGVVSGGGADADTTLIARDGAERFIASSTAPILDAKSHKLTGVVLVFRDMTQKRADRRDRDRATQFLDSIVEHIPDMIFVKGAEDLRFQRVNRAGEVLLGMTREELIGKNDYDFFPKEQADFFQAKDRQTLSRGQVVEIVEEPINTKSGVRWLHTKKVPLLGEDGEPRFLLGISEDITESKQTAEALRSAMVAAESANHELEAFSYSVAHDLRAPLRSIDGFSQAIIEDCSDQLDDVGRQHLQRVRGSAARMAELIDGLLGLSRLTRTEMRLELVDLSAMATTAAEELRQQSPKRDISVRIAPSLGARGDPRILRIVVDNLFGNAFKFTAKRPRATIEFGVLSEEGAQVFFVRDDGVGFDPRYKDKLFGAFQRLHDAREFPGTGIGLATVQRAVKRHGGRVWAESEPGRGATFFFTLNDDAAMADKSRGERAPSA